MLVTHSEKDYDMPVTHSEKGLRHAGDTVPYYFVFDDATFEYPTVTYLNTVLINILINMCPVRVELRFSDIVSIQANVCVSSIHRTKDMSLGPLARHILRYGGKTIQDEIYTKQPEKDFKIGQVEVLSPGKLTNFNELMFVCLRSYEPGNEEILQQSILECLELAAVKNYKSIAFPALGIGQNYPPEKVAMYLIEAVAMHNYQYPSTPLDVVYIVLLEKEEELIKMFLLMCVKGTTDLKVDTQTATDIDPKSDLVSGLSFKSDSVGSGKPIHGKPGMPQSSHRPKRSGQKSGSQHTGNKSFSFGSTVTSIVTAIAGRSLSFKMGYLNFNVRPQISKKKIGVQINANIDISFIEKLIPPPVRTFWNTINR